MVPIGRRSGGAASKQSADIPVSLPVQFKITPTKMSALRLLAASPERRPIGTIFNYHFSASGSVLAEAGLRFRT
jgi:hypothetical protein